MKKKYTQARLGLCIALLTFHTFSSCVHTSHPLAMDQRQKCDPYANYHKPETKLRDNLTKFVPLCIIILWVVGFPIWTIGSHMGRRSSVFNTTGSSSNASIVPTLAPVVLNATISSISNDYSGNNSDILTEKLDQAETIFRSASPKFGGTTPSVGRVRKPLRIRKRHGIGHIH